MSDILVNVVMFSGLPAQELTLHLRGETTLGELRNVIYCNTGGGRPLDSAWVSFADTSRGTIPFAHANPHTDSLQLRYLMYEPDSPVRIGALRYSVPPENNEDGIPAAEQQQPGQGVKRKTHYDEENFDRSGRARHD